MSATILRTSGSVRLACSTVKSCMGSEYNLVLLRAPLFLDLSFLETTATPFLRGFVPAQFLRRLRSQLGDFDRLTLRVDSHECEVTGVRVSSSTCQQLFGFDAHTHLHRRPTHEIDTRFHDDEIAQEDRFPEIDAVDRRRNDARTRMAKGSDCRALVHHRENHATEYVTEVVGVARHHELGGLVLAFLDGLRWPGGHGWRRKRGARARRTSTANRNGLADLERAILARSS